MHQTFRVALLAASAFVLSAATALADELENVVVAEVSNNPAAADTADVPPSAQQPAGPRPVAVDLSFANYKVELLMITLVVGLVVNYFSGSKKNKELFQAWEEPANEVLRENFSLMGDGSQAFSWESASDMLFYGSGRRNCKYVQGHVALKARHDAVALVNDIVAKTQDKIQMTIAFNDGDSVPGFVFAAVPRKRAKAISRERYDIETFAKMTNNSKIANRIALFSENADATSQLLDSGLDKMLSKDDSLLEELYVTDTPSVKPEKHDFKMERRMVAVIRLPSVPDAQGKRLVKEAMEFIFYLTDHIAEAIKLRPESVRKLAKAREEAFKEFARMAEKERQEALANFQAEKRRNELGEVEKMTPEQQRKWEEKDRKKQLKKEQSKRVRRMR